MGATWANRLRLRFPNCNLGSQIAISSEIASWRIPIMHNPSPWLDYPAFRPRFQNPKSLKNKVAKEKRRRERTYFFRHETLAFRRLSSTRREMRQMSSIVGIVVERDRLATFSKSTQVKLSRFDEPITFIRKGYFRLT
jgi:hypothetical protein